MKVAKNMDSVFDNCTKDEAEFDVYFDDDDTIIDIIEGMQDCYEDILSEINEAADADVSIPEDEEYNKDKGSEKDAEGSKNVNPQLDGEVGDKKTVTGNEKSEESKAHDVTKDIEDAIGANDKKQTSLEAAEEVDPLTDDDEAERAGEVPPETVETEGVIQDKIKEKKAAKAAEKAEKADAEDEACKEAADGQEKDDIEDKTEPAEAEDEKCCKESDDSAFADSVIAKIKALREADEPESDKEETSDDHPAVAEDEKCTKEATIDDKIMAKIAEKVAAREAAEAKMLDEVLDEMTEEELNSDNVKELIEAKVAEKKAKEEAKKICKGCGKSVDKCTCKSANEAADPIEDNCDKAMRDGKAPRPTSDVEGVKQHFIDKVNDGKAPKDCIEDEDDAKMRDGKAPRPTNDVEGVSQSSPAAALEATDNIDDLLSDDDEVIDVSGLEDTVPDKDTQEYDTSNEIKKDLETQSESLLPGLALEKVEDEELTDEDDELIEIADDEDDSKANTDLHYDYDDDELIDIVIDEEE